MKRLSLIAILLLGSALSAHADNDIYTNITKRGHGLLHAEAGRAAERRADLAPIQELHARPRLALQSHGARALHPGAHVSRSG